MQFSQVCRQFRVLDLKTIAEYCADINGFETAGLVTGQSYDCSSDRFLSTKGGALFSLLQRIPVVDLYGFIPPEAYVSSLPDTTLQSTCSFFDALKSEQFSRYVIENRDAIMHNDYIKTALTSSKFDILYGTLFADREAFDSYIDFIYQETCRTLLKMELSNDTILSLYTEIPQLRTGVLNRLKKASPNIFGKQPGLFADAFAAFKNYMKKVSFDAENNETTVVEGYIGYCLQFFINSDFRTFLSTYQTPKAVAYIGENDSYCYTADLIKAEIKTPHSATNLAEVFSAVEAIDYAFFARKKTNVMKTMLPYASIVDFVSGIVLKPKVAELSALLKRNPVTRSLAVQVVPSYRGDLQLVYDSVDQSFRDRISQGKNIFRAVFNMLREITPATVGTSCRALVQSNSRAESMKKDSNFNIIPTSGVSYDGITIYSDDSYKVIGQIVDIFNHLFRLQQELQTYDTSLPYLWHTYIRTSPQRGVDIFRSHSTVASFLQYILSRGQTNATSYADVYGDAIEPLNIYVKEANRQMFLQVLNTPRLKAIDFQGLKSISTARLHKTPELSGTSLIEMLHATFLHIRISAFESDFDFCKDKTVVPFEICQFLYRDLMRVPFLFKTNEADIDFDDPLIADSMIDCDPDYNFLGNPLGCEEYCLVMMQKVVKSLTDDSWACFTGGFKSLCIALLELVPRGELENHCSLKGDLFMLSKEFSYLPALTKSETDTLLQWIDLAATYLSEDTGIFSRQDFITFVEQLSIDTLNAHLQLDLSIEQNPQEIANIFALRWFYGAFAVLWKWVSNSCRYYIVEPAVSVFSDAKLITDMAFSELHVLSDINTVYTKYMAPFTEHLHVIQALDRDSSNKQYSIACALELQQAIAIYRGIRGSFFDQLKACCSCINSTNATFRAFELLEMNLRDMLVETNISYNYMYGSDDAYLGLLSNQLCGCIYWFILEGNIASTVKGLTTLAEHEYQVNAFLLNSISLTDSKYIPRTLKPVDAFFTRHTAKLAMAYKLPEYKSYLMSNHNTDISLMNEFRKLLLSAVLDENGFCTIQGNYVIARDVNDTCHFLTKDGIWVGYLSDIEPLSLKAFFELTMEINHDRTI